MTVPAAHSYRDEVLQFLERLAGESVLIPCSVRNLPGFQRLVGGALATGYLVESAEGFRIDFDAITRNPLCDVCSEPMTFAEDIRAGRHLACASDDLRTGDGTTPDTLSRVCW